MIIIASTFATTLGPIFHLGHPLLSLLAHRIEPTDWKYDMASLRDRNRSRTRDDIEAAAIELFERHGYAATTVEQIARQAGVSQATFFRHFGSKEEVLFANEQDNVAEHMLRAAIADNGDSDSARAGAHDA